MILGERPASARRERPHDDATIGSELDEPELVEPADASRIGVR